jgi:SAM-dependent methyltransferase
VKPHKRYVLASLLEGSEALGQLGGADDLEEDIATCPLQTIDSAFRQYLPLEGRILEAGAGRGRWVFHLRRLGYDIQGIELAGSEVRFAKTFDPSAPLIVGNVLKTSFPDHSFAAIISLGVLEHFEEGPQEALGEVRRLLARDGTFLVTVPTRNLLRFLLIDRMKHLQIFVRRMLGRRLAFEEYRYTRKQFTAILLDAGFTVVEMVPDDFRPPKNMGLYTDSRFLRSNSRRWELNGAGRMLKSFMDLFSPWLSCSGTLWVCRVRTERASA